MDALVHVKKSAVNLVAVQVVNIHVMIPVMQVHVVELAVIHVQEVFKVLM